MEREGAQLPLKGLRASRLCLECGTWGKRLHWPRFPPPSLAGSTASASSAGMKVQGSMGGLTPGPSTPSRQAHLWECHTQGSRASALRGHCGQEGPGWGTLSPWGADERGTAAALSSNRSGLAADRQPRAEPATPDIRCSSRTPLPWVTLKAQSPGLLLLFLYSRSCQPQTTPAVLPPTSFPLFIQQAFQLY